MTISVEKSQEDAFREAAIKEFGDKKGSIKKAIEKAMGLYIGEQERQESVKRLMEKLRKGHHLGDYVFNREDAYDRD